MMIRKDIFDAVTQIVKQDGFHKLTIPQIAEFASMEPIVVLRGFSTVEGVIEQYVERFDFWMSYFSKEELVNLPSSRDSYKLILRELIDMVFYRKEIQQLIAWELSENSRLTQSIAQRHDFSTNLIVDQYEGAFEGSGLDFRMVSSILVSAIYYLSAYRNRSTSFGLDLAGRAGKKQIIDGIDMMIDLVFDRVEKVKEKEIARRLFDKGESVDVIAEVTGLSVEETISAINKFGVGDIL